MSASEDLYSCLESAARRRAAAAAQLAADICRVPAPTGSEGERAEFVARLWRQRGYAPTSDDVGNVIVRRGPAEARALLLAAHLDTVFPAETKLDVQRSDDRLAGPGIGDNSLGLAALLTLSDVLDEHQIELPVGVYFLSNVGEEGLGNLLGIRAAVDRLRPELGAVVAVEGHNLGRVTNVGVGSKRWRVEFSGPGGHSWGAYGQPSTIHRLAAAVAEVAGRELPESPKTTFNVGLINGGTSVNTIAAHAEVVIDMRSTDAHVLDELTGVARASFERQADSDVSVTIDVLGERPVGGTAPDHPIVTMAQEALRWVGVDPVLDASSTDANYPMSLGIPAVCIGITRGGRGHSIEEYISVPPIATGLAQLGRLLVDVTAWLHESA